MVLNPDSSATTVYLPVGRDGAVYSPAASVTSVRVKPVLTFLSVTLAPGITAPLVSVTVPRSVPVTAWAASEPVSRLIAMIRRATLLTFDLHAPAPRRRVDGMNVLQDRLKWHRPRRRPRGPSRLSMSARGMRSAGPADADRGDDVGRSWLRTGAAMHRRRPRVPARRSRTRARRITRSSFSRRVAEVIVCGVSALNFWVDIHAETSRLRLEGEQRLARGGAVRRQNRADARPHETHRLRRQHALEIDHLPVIQNRNLRRLARRIAQRDQMRVARLPQVKIGRRRCCRARST